ncbi:MAG: hypothetical protein Q8N77_03775 [Nanoarchaeota archaeon]|nr:hypothetical protein [Nanoarchaeota archaeon]
MKKELIVVFLLFVLFVAGCGQKVEIKIGPDETKEPEKPLCNLDGKCDVGEKCDCADCKETFDCRKAVLSEDEYLLKQGTSERIGGKTLVFLELDSSGKTTVSVDGVKRVIERTKFMEIVNGLEVTVLETEYATESGNRIVKVLSKAYAPGLDEYLFSQVGSEKIVESVRIRLNKVEYSSPSNYVLVDVGNSLNSKLKESETMVIEGLSITAVEVHPRGTPLESYAILKIKKA